MGFRVLLHIANTVSHPASTVQPTSVPCTRGFLMLQGQVSRTHSRSQHVCVLVITCWGKPHIDRDNVPRHGECLYVCIYVATGSICRLNVPENTSIHVAHVHIGNVYCCTKYWTCWTRRMYRRSLLLPPRNDSRSLGSS